MCHKKHCYPNGYCPPGEMRRWTKTNWKSPVYLLSNACKYTEPEQSIMFQRANKATTTGNMYTFRGADSCAHWKSLYLPVFSIITAGGLQQEQSVPGPVFFCF